MKQISSFMSEIGDEFKIVVVKAIRELCLKYPKKHRVMVGFLATFLREEGACLRLAAWLLYYSSSRQLVLSMGNGAGFADWGLCL
jgi:hypothetical protein